MKNAAYILYMATHSDHLTPYHKDHLHLVVILSISSFVFFLTNQQVFVMVLFIVAIISSNKNIMHREKKVVRVVLLAR